MGYARRGCPSSQSVSDHAKYVEMGHLETKENALEAERQKRSRSSWSASPPLVRRYPSTELFDLIGVQKAFILGNPNCVNSELVVLARWDSPAIEDLGQQIATNIRKSGVLNRLPELACLGRRTLVPLREKGGFQTPQPAFRFEAMVRATEVPMVRQARTSCTR